MKFAVIEPAKARWDVVDHKSLKGVQRLLGLDKVDHGVIAPPQATRSGVGIMIVVDEFSIFKPQKEQRYFAIGRQLFGGNAVLYGFNEIGETVDLEEMPLVLFMTVVGVEDAIQRGQIDRPCTEINGERMWQWPEPNPYRAH